MRSVLAIFRKDVRRLWPQIAVFLLLLPLSAVVGTGAALHIQSSGGALGAAALLACCYLIAALILQEPLAGDRQYWLTRPIGGRQLLAGKLLFVAVFVSLPTLITQVAILVSLGISPLRHLDALFWRQLFLCAQVILPSVALFALNRNFTQLLLVCLASVTVFAIPHRLFYEAFFTVWIAPAWFGPAARQVLLLVVAACVIYSQYLRQSQWTSRIAVGALAIFFYLVTQTAWEDPIPRSVLISLDTSTPHPRPSHSAGAEIPLKIGGLPLHSGIFVGPVRLAAYTPNGRRLGDIREASIRDFLGDHPRLILPVIAYSADVPLKLSGSVDVTVYQPLQAGPVPESGVARPVPGIGACAQRQNEWNRSSIVCLAPSARTALGLQFGDGSLRWVIPPGMVDLPGSFATAFQPIDRFEGFPGGLIGDHPHYDTARAMFTARTVGRYRGVFDFPDIRLADYPEPE